MATPTWEVPTIDEITLAEEEPCPDSDEPLPQKKRKKRVITKGERKDMAELGRNISISELGPCCLDKANNLLSTHKTELVKDFGRSLNWDDIKFVTKFLKASFAKIYENCGTGKEKFMTFQFRWYQCCSIMLVRNTTDLVKMNVTLDDEAVTIRQQWVSLYTAHKVSSDVANTFMLVLTSEVYHEILRRCHTMLQPTPRSAQPATADPIDVYYRFGGATLARMLQARYSTIKCCPADCKEQLGKEISLLQNLNTKDKSRVPKFLLYRDKGFMYFPCEQLLAFLQLIDIQVKNNANENNFRKHGKNLIKVITDELQSDDTLRGSFCDVLEKVYENFDIKEVGELAITKVLNEFIQKMCNTRIQEFIESFKIISAAQKGTAAIGGQNLRDTLLTHHINLKTSQRS